MSSRLFRQNADIFFLMNSVSILSGRPDLLFLVNKQTKEVQPSGIGHRDLSFV